ncbi:MAG: MMPL family transporter [Verrucomicrobiaceae bacterium]|nr:MMPL family transporter [Verrucomicrobiaceae bacterium]
MTRRYIFLWILCVLVLSAIALSRLSFNVDPLDVLPEDASGVKGLRIFSEKFSGKGELIITLELENAEIQPEAQSLVAHLRQVDGLTSWVEWQPLWEENPAVASQLPAYVWLNGDHGDLARFLDRLSSERIGATLEEVIDELSFGLDGEALALAAYDPLKLLRPPAFSEKTREDSGIGSGGKYVSADGSFRAVYVGAPQDKMNYSESADWVGKVRAAVNEWQWSNGVGAGLKVGFTGEPAFAAEIGGGMQRDMNGSILSALALIHLVFWLMHRRLLPLAAIFFTLLLILSVTVIVGSLVLGRLSVMSVGFAAILIGLAVDYGVVLYQQSRHQEGTFREVYTAVGRGILWAAFTTAVVFASLGFSSLPGIRELGLLVALGVVLGAGIMLLVFGPVAASLGRANPLIVPVSKPGKMSCGRVCMPLTLALCVGLAWVLCFQGIPGFHKGLDVLRPSNSPADEAFSRISEMLSPGEGLSLPMIVVDDSLEGVGQRALIAEGLADELIEKGVVSSAVFTSSLIPSVKRQRKNIPLIRKLLQEEQRLRAALEVDFSGEAQQAVDAVFSEWRNLLRTTILPIRPSGDEVVRIVGGVVSESGKRPAAMGLLKVEEGKVEEVQEVIAGHEGIHVTGWQTMGRTIQRLVQRDLYMVFIPMACLLLVMLSVVFRDAAEVALGVAVLVLSAVGLLVVMRIAGWQWNVLNICAFPLLIGTGIDYTIHMIGSLRLHGGARDPVRLGIGRALLFCGISTAIGFGSLSLANNAGLASLGRVCASGILVTMVVAVFLLPGWWRLIKGRSLQPE